MNEDILKSLRFTNSVVETDEIIIEKCSDYVPDLETYYITLPYSSLSIMEFLIRGQYDDLYFELITAAFESKDKRAITQLCKLFANSKSYTQMFIDRSGGVSNLLRAPSGGFGSGFEYEEEEDPEVIKELEEKIKELELQVQAKDVVISEKDENIDTLSEKVSVLDEYKDLIDNISKMDSLERTDADLICDYLVNLDGNSCKDVMANLIGLSASEVDLDDENVDLNKSHILKIFLNNVATAIELVDGE